ncbi:MAG: hypothetical protein ACFB0G_08500 [Leptolyngbyaceae cyanobacterium]
MAILPLLLGAIVHFLALVVRPWASAACQLGRWGDRAGQHRD